MKRIILILILALASCAATSLSIRNPGATGMNSRVDVDGYRQSDSRYALNVDISKSVGGVSQRPGLKVVGDNALPVFSAVAHADIGRQEKHIVGLTVFVDSVDYPTVDSGTTTFTTTDLFRLAVSDNGGSGLDSIISAGNVFGTQPFADIVQTPDGIVITSGGIPFVFKTQFGAIATTMQEDDTTYYRPHFQPLALEAPGQLRVAPTNITSAPTLDGIFRYSYVPYPFAYQKNRIPSRWIVLRDQRAYVTLFEMMQWYFDDGYDTLYLCRQEYGKEWRVIDSFQMAPDQSIIYIDSLAASAGRVIGGDTIAENWLNREPIIDYAPGCLYSRGTGTRVYDSSVNLTASDTEMVCSMDSSHIFAYSYYDPILDIESPLGWFADGLLTYATGADTFLVACEYSVPRPFDRPQWIRVYRSEAGALPASGLVPEVLPTMYPVVQQRAGYHHPDTTRYTNMVFPGVGHDSSITNGCVLWLDTGFYYYGNDIIPEFGGLPVTRPTYIPTYDLHINHIAYANGRMWGGGDILYPSRLYYSAYDTLSQFTALDYLSLDENDNDEIVSLVSLPSGDADILYVFKHNSIYAIVGYDAEYDLTVARIPATGGAISNRATLVRDDIAYFAAPDLNIYRMTPDGAITELSAPVKDWAESTLVSYADALDSVVAFSLENKICWYSSTSDLTLAYDLILNTWSLESYGSNITPYGSFSMDTVQTRSGAGKYSWWVFQSDSAEQFRVEADIGYDSGGPGVGYAVEIELQVEADGEHMWRVQSATITAIIDSGETLTAYVFNQDYDTLATGTVEGDSRTFNKYHIGFGPHAADYPFVRFVTDTTIHNFELSGVEFEVTNQGRLRRE